MDTASLSYLNEPAQEGSAQYHKAIDACAEYFLDEVLSKVGRLSTLESTLLDRFGELAGDAFDNDELETLLRLSATDHCEAGRMLDEKREELCHLVAIEFREELEPLAIEAGYIKEVAA